MKRFILSIWVLALAMGASAKNYLVSSAATTDGATITYKGVDYVVGENAFATLAAFLEANPEANSDVYVAPGVWAETITINVNGLTFYGNNANCEARSKNRSSSESTITKRWTIAANNITLNGFAFTEKGQVYDMNARNGSPLKGFKFLFNTVSASTLSKSSSTSVVQFGKYASQADAKDDQWQSRYQNFEVAHNVFTGSATNNANFVIISGGYGTTKVEDNKFTDGGTSIYMNNGRGTISIRNNTFKNVGDTARLAQGTTYGEFCISLRYCGKAATNIYIQNNVFNGCQGQGSIYPLIRFFNGDDKQEVMPLVNSKLYINYKIFKKKPKHSSRDYNYVYYGSHKYTGNTLVVDSRFNEYDNSEYCIGTVYQPGETEAGRVFASSMGLLDYASKAGTTVDYFASPCGSTIKDLALKCNRVCQNFDIDETTGDIYFIQIDPSNGAVGKEPQTVTRCYKKSDGTTGYQYMYLGNAAHGTDMTVCRMSDGKLYLFCGGDSETTSTASRSMCFFRFVSGATVNMQKESFTHNGTTYTIKKMTSGNGKKGPYASIDKQNRLLCEYSRSTNYTYFTIYDLDDAFTNLSNATKLKSIKIQKLTNAYSSTSNAYQSIDQGYLFWAYQGFAINGDYIYVAEGMGKEGMDGYTNVYDDGKVIPVVMINAYNWRTDTWEYRKPVLKSAILNMSHGEPEGVKLRRDANGRTNMYLQVINGLAGARKTNVFEYIAKLTGYAYKVPAVTMTPTVTELAFAATSLTEETKSMKISADYLLGDVQAVVTGADAKNFKITLSDAHKFGRVWDKKTTIQVSYTPTEGQTSYTATLRISSPNASDVLVTLKGEYTPPAPPTPPTPVAKVYYELNGGKLPKAGEVPTNDSLWAAFKPYYNTFYGLNRADQPITAVSTFASAKMCEIMTKSESAYKWLGDYIIQIAAEQGYTLTNDTTAEDMEALWRWHVHSFFNCNQHTTWPNTADFAEAGKPESWGDAYREVYGTAIVLPEVITETYVLPTPVREGYTFGGWYWESDFIGAPVEQLEVGADGTLYAKWEIKNNTTTYLETLGANTAGVVKFFKDGRIVIWKDGTCYDIQGNIIR